MGIKEILADGVESTSAGWDFTLANYDAVWHALVQIGLLLLFLCIGNMLRNVIPFFKKSLIPSALIGGTLLLTVHMIFKTFGVEFIDRQMMQIVVYHGLGIGFAAMSLKVERPKGKLNKSQALEFGLLQGGTYMIQAFIGLVITILLFVLTKNSENVISYIAGIILPLGFGQGPGNALTWDINFTNMAEATQFFGWGSFGLSLASIGFIVASVFGVTYINIQKKKGALKIRNHSANMENEVEYVSNNEIPDSESVDKFSIQMGLVAIVYAIAFAIMVFFAKLSDFTNGIAWGFNFIWAALGAILLRTVLVKLKEKKVIKRKYINNYQMDRISGFAFDLMIVAGVAAIEINNVKRYILPLIILSLVGAIVTWIYIRLVAKECFKGFEHEFFLMSFGTMTGTASNGMILMKEVDPSLATPTSNLYVKSTIFSILSVAPLLLLLNFAGSSFANACIACVIFLVLFIIYTIYLFRRRIFKKKFKGYEYNVWSEEEE